MIDKKAFNVNINPSSAIGAITGATIANNKITKDYGKRIGAEQNATNIGTNYYTQVENIEKNLKVIFTPFNVLFVLKNGAKQLTLDSIDTSEMDEAMRSAYMNRDADYFKRILLNKIRSEVQIAEQIFAKKMIEQKMRLQDEFQNSYFNKKANEIEFGELLDNVSALKCFFEKNAGTELINFFEKNAAFNDIEIETNLDNIRPIAKYAGLLNSITSFFGLNLKKEDLKELQGFMDDPNYVKSKLVIGFLPDRVLFIVNNNVLTQLGVLQMNEEGFEAFQNQNKDYFRKMFKDEVRKRAKDESDFFKNASYNGIGKIFQISTVHPKIYYNELMQKFGDDWLKFDQESIIKILEDEYSLDEGISDIPLNKVWCLQLINISGLPYTNAFVFEKCIRTFNNRPIDFEEQEYNYTLDEIVFGLEIMQELTPNDDIFDNFSDEVKEYIANVLVNNEFRVVYPCTIIDSDTEKQFYKDINSLVLSKVNDIISLGLDDDNKRKDIVNNNILINASSIKIIDAIKDRDINLNLSDLILTVNMVSDKLNTDNVSKNIIIRNILNNLSTGIYVNQMSDLYKKQLELLK